MSIRFEISPNGSGSERERRKGLHRCSIGGGEGDRAPPLGPNIARPIVDCCAATWQTAPRLGQRTLPMTIPQTVESDDKDLPLREDAFLATRCVSRKAQRPSGRSSVSAKARPKPTL